MLAELTILPLDSEHVSADIARAARALEQAGVRYRVGPTSTTIEAADWDEMMDAVKRAHHAVANGHARVVTTVVIDDHRGADHTMEEAVRAVEARV